VLTIFQLLAAINFATHFVALRKQSFKPYVDEIEMAESVFSRWFCFWGSCVYFNGIGFCGTQVLIPIFFTALRYATLI